MEVETEASETEARDRSIEFGARAPGGDYISHLFGMITYRQADIIESRFFFFSSSFFLFRFIFCGEVSSLLSSN